MKVNFVLAAMAAWCLWRSASEIPGLIYSGLSRTDFGWTVYEHPWINDHSGETTGWIVLVVGGLLIQPLWMQGIRWWLIPLMLAILMMNPFEEIVEFKNGAQPSLIAGLVFLAYIPHVRNFLGRIWKE